MANYGGSSLGESGKISEWKKSEWVAAPANDAAFGAALDSSCGSTRKGNARQRQRQLKWCHQEKFSCDRIAASIQGLRRSHGSRK